MKRLLIPALGLLALIFLLKGDKMERAVSTAERYVGQQETGNNAGFIDINFQVLMIKYGWWSGAAWCVLFARMVWLMAFPEKKFIINKVITPHTLSTWANLMSDQSGNFKVVNYPVPGAMVIYESTTNALMGGHAGIVRRVIDNERFEAIEGNYQDSVKVVTRPTKDDYQGLRVKGFILLT